MLRIVLTLLFISSWSHAFSLNGVFFTALGKVTVSNILPDSGNANGGGTVTIYGLGFKPGAVASIGGVNCTSTTYVSPTSLTCVVPANSSIGLKNVAVVNSDSSTGTLVNGFGYVGSPSLWLKADDLALADGANVTTWGDSSGSGNTATTMTAIYPTFSAGSINTKPAVKFAGAQYMDSTLAQTSVVKNTMFVVHNPGGAGVAIGGSACCSPNYMLTNGMFGSTGNNYTVKNSSNAQTSAGNSSTTNQNVFSIAAGRFNSAYPASDTGTTIDAYSNGTHYTNSMVGTIGTGGGNIEIGARYSGSSYFFGSIAEVIIYNSALSDADLLAVQCYLGHKYGTATTGCP